jgi:invasion protein IalB
MLRSTRILMIVALSAAALPMAGAAHAQGNRPAAQARTAPAAQNAAGQQGSAVAQFGDWGVFTSATQRGKVCYAASQPKQRAPGNLQRDPAFFFITSRPGENVRNEISLILGFALRGDATVAVGPTNFAMYTKEKGAWVKNAAEETRMITTMRSGSQLTVRSTSSRGNVTTDTYSLTGLSQALDRVAQECR